MKVSQFCVIFNPEIRPADPSGFELVTVLWSFYSENLFRSLFKSSVVLVFMFKEGHRESKCVFKAFCFRKMIDQVFFPYRQAEIRTCSVFELVRGSRRDPSQGL